MSTLLQFYLSGEEISEGDLVSAPAYPKGTIRGKIVIKHAEVFQSGNRYTSYFMIQAEDGTLYNTPKKTRKLKNG
jgi:hypothetical protein